MIKFNDLGAQWAEIREEALIAIDELGTRGDYIGGKAISDFEAKFAAYTGSAFGVGISNGTDALKIAFQIFDLSGQDLVIMPANTFIANYLALKNLPVSGRATPEVYLVDHDKHFTISTTDLENFLSRKRNNYRQVVVVAVHLYGHPCDLQTLKDLKHKYDFILLEDCSQSHGTKSKEFNPGDLGEISVYSLYPGKNLGALGDAGILTTNDPEIYRRAKILRNYGSPVKYHYDEMGNNHRLDTLQAIVLSLKLDRLDQWNLAKQKVAERYSREINNLGISLPINAPWCEFHSYHIYCVKVLGNRENFMQHLSDHGVPTIIHYPIPIHKTNIFGGPYELDFVFNSELTDLYADRIVSLPMHPFLKEEEVTLIINTINSWQPV